MVKVQCIKCGREGSLTRKQTKSKGITYIYWYIEHHIGNKIKWCYLGKLDKLPDNYQTIIHKDTQNIYKSETPKSTPFEAKEVNQTFLPVLLADTRQLCKLNRIC